MQIDQRIEYIDQLKGLAILMVVVGHIYNFVSIGDNNVLIKTIDAINMPLFFFLNGVVLHYIEDGWGMQYLKKTERILLPFFAWGIIKMLWREEGFVSFMTDYWKFGYWYLWVLYIFVIIHIGISFVAKQLNKKENMWIDILICTIVYLMIRQLGRFIPEAWHGFTDYFQVLNYLPYFLAGTLVFRHNLMNRLNSTHIGALISLSFVTTIFTLWMGGVNYEYFILFSSWTFIIVMFIVFGKSDYSKNVIGQAVFLKPLSWLGRHSLAIYMIHYFFIPMVNLKVPFSWLLETENYMFLIISAILIAFALSSISIFIESIMQKSKLLTYLFFGKRKEPIIKTFY